MPKEKRQSPREKRSISDSSAENVTYEIPGELITVRCCLCHNPIKKGSGGWCTHCDAWPINITPIRWCNRGHRVNPDGWCAVCADHLLTFLDPQPGEWIDTGRVPRTLTHEEVKRLAQDVAKKLSGPGWPEKIVPLRRDFIPKAWRRRPLRVVGQTPLGYDIVIPDDAPAGIAEPAAVEDDVPF